MWGIETASELLFVLTFYSSVHIALTMPIAMSQKCTLCGAGAGALHRELSHRGIVIDPFTRDLYANTLFYTS